MTVSQNLHCVTETAYCDKTFIVYGGRQGGKEAPGFTVQHGIQQKQSGVSVM